MIKNITIVSTGRTGTKSLAYSLNKLPDITATHEKLSDITRRVSNGLWDNTITEEQALELLNKRVEAKPNNIWVDVNCLLWNCLYLIDNNKICYIYITRNKKDTIESFLATDFYGKNKLPWSKRAQSGFIDIRKPSYSLEDQRQNCIKAYDIRTKRIEEQLRNIEHNRWIHVKFEDMIASKDAQKTILDFISLKTDIDIDPQKFHLVHEHKKC